MRLCTVRTQAACTYVPTATAAVQRQPLVTRPLEPPVTRTRLGPAAQTGAWRRKTCLPNKAGHCQPTNSRTAAHKHTCYVTYLESDRSAQHCIRYTEYRSQFNKARRKSQKQLLQRLGRRRIPSTSERAAFVPTRRQRAVSHTIRTLVTRPLHGSTMYSLYSPSWPLHHSHLLLAPSSLALVPQSRLLAAAKCRTASFHVPSMTAMQG